jgi:hypothetical protein
MSPFFTPSAWESSMILSSSLSETGTRLGGSPIEVEEGEVNGALELLSTLGALLEGFPLLDGDDSSDPKGDLGAHLRQGQMVRARRIIRLFKRTNKCT